MSNIDRNPSMCAAFGCPCAGVMTSSGSGTKDWLCNYHFGRDASSWQHITATLNRLSFIVESRQKIFDFRNRSSWPDVYREIQQTLRVNNRADLCYAEGEGTTNWAGRLAAALDDATRGRQRELTPAAEMTAAMVDSADTFKRVSFPVAHV